MMKGRMFPRISACLMAMIMIFTLGACGSNTEETENMEVENKTDENVASISVTYEDIKITDTVAEPAENSDGQDFVGQNFVLITGGTFEMGSPDTEAWRIDDEARHTVTVSDFYMDIYEVTQA